jgi:hypothetical protein
MTTLYDATVGGSVGLIPSVPDRAPAAARRRRYGMRGGHRDHPSRMGHFPGLRPAQAGTGIAGHHLAGGRPATHTGRRTASPVRCAGRGDSPSQSGRPARRFPRPQTRFTLSGSSQTVASLRGSSAAAEVQVHVPRTAASCEVSPSADRPFTRRAVPCSSRQGHGASASRVLSKDAVMGDGARHADRFYQDRAMRHRSAGLGARPLTPPARASHPRRLRQRAPPATIPAARPRHVATRLQLDRPASTAGVR